MSCTSIIMLAVCVLLTIGSAQARLIASGGPSSAALQEVAGAIAYDIMGKPLSQEQKRGEFTTRVVSSLTSRSPGWSAMIVHSDHAIAPRDSLVSQRVEFYYERVGGPSAGFTVYMIPSIAGRVVFTLKGDGGFQNWAFAGNLQRDGGNVLFNP